MPWDGIRRRSDDGNYEAPEVVLARVDENIKFLKSGAEAVKIQLAEHEKKDNVKFDAIDAKQDKTNNIVIWASGAVSVLVLILDVIFRH